MKIINFMVDENLLKEFDYCVKRLGLTRTELLVALMEFAVRCSKDGKSFLTTYLEILESYSGSTAEDARVLASFYKEEYERDRR